MIQRLRTALGDVALVAGTSLRGVADDPLGFLVQVNRRLRLLPTPRRIGTTAWSALRWFMADRPEVAKEILGAHTTSRWGERRLRNWLHVTLGLRRATDRDSARLQAHDAYQAGHLTRAAALAPRGSALNRRIESELAVLAPSPAHPSPRREGLSKSEPRPLFVLTNSLPYTHSGYTTRTHSMLTALSALGIPLEAVTRIGYPTTVGLLAKPLAQRIDGVTYRRLPAWRLPLRSDERLARQVTAVVKAARAMRATVLHTTTDFTNGVVTRAAAAELGIPWVYEMRGMLEMTWVASRPDAIRAEAAASERVRLLRAKETELAQSADAVIVLSSAQRDDLLTRGVPAGKVTVIPNGIDETVLTVPDPGAATVRAQLGLPAEGFWVGSVSALVDYEGFDTLIRAIALCRAAGHDVRGAIVGHGVSAPRLQGLVAELGLGDAVSLPGRKEAAEAQLWYQALDAFVVPRRDLEVTRLVTPLKPLAAMGLGRPVIASDLPALRELLTEAEHSAGRLVTADSVEALAAAITEVASDPGLRARLARAGRAVAAGRTWQNAGRRCLDIYREVQDGEVR